MENHKQHPRVGVGVTIFKDGKVLMGKRKNAHGAGEWSWPGGHLEHLESFESCARRETLEETGIEIKNVRFLRLMNLTAYAPRQYVHVSLVADWASGEPRLLEPDSCEEWRWFDLKDLPDPVFATINGDLEALETGRNFYDADVH